MGEMAYIHSLKTFGVHTQAFGTIIQENIQGKEGVTMSGYLAIECGKELKTEEKDIDDHAVGNNLSERLNRLFAGIKLRIFSHDHGKDDKEGRTTGKCRCQESGSQNCRQPEVPARNTGIQKGSDCMNRRRPGN